MARQTGPVYRCTSCDNCQKAKQDCIWVKRLDAGHEDDDPWCLCGDCRRNCKAKNLPLVNVDVDFKDVAA